MAGHRAIEGRPRGSLKRKGHTCLSLNLRYRKETSTSTYNPPTQRQLRGSGRSDQIYQAPRACLWTPINPGPTVTISILSTSSPRGHTEGKYVLFPYTRPGALTSRENIQPRLVLTVCKATSQQQPPHQRGCERGFSEKTPIHHCKTGTCFLQHASLQEIYPPTYRPYRPYASRSPVPHPKPPCMCRWVYQH